METITKFNNIYLSGDRFQVFATICGNEETNTFMPDATANDIRNWALERKAYYEDLKAKELELQDELIGIEL